MEERKITSEELYRMIDADGSGLVDMREFRQSMLVFGYFHEKHLKCLQNFFDIDRSGKMEK